MSGFVAKEFKHDDENLCKRLSEKWNSHEFCRHWLGVGGLDVCFRFVVFFKNERKENPYDIAVRLSEHFAPPLDVIDGAARCLDPIFDGLITGKHLSGKFLKNYKECPW